MAWFRKERPEKVSPDAPDKKVKVPEGLWIKCDNCKEIIYRKEVDKNYKVCPKCDYHFRISASERLPYLVDEGSFLEVEDGLSPKDFLGFKDYKDKLKSNRKKTGLKDAIISGNARVGGMPVSIVVMDFNFMGGSMGSVVGEKIARAVERAIEKKTPFIAISASGGARMQEGILSLMQMAKTSAAIARLGEAGLPFIAVLTDPSIYVAMIHGANTTRRREFGMGWSRLPVETVRGWMGEEKAA